MASPDHAATAMTRAFQEMTSEDRFMAIVEDPSTLDALLSEADALVAALAQAEGERNQARDDARHIRNLHDWRIRDLQDVRADRDFLRDRAERAERQRDQATQALREIAGMGARFDAKGTHSKRVVEIAREALAAIEKNTA